MSLQGSAARGGAITLASQGLRLVVMLTSTVILARVLVPSDFGLVAMVTAIVGVADIFRDFGLSMAALQAKALSAEQKSNLFWINTAVGIVMSVIVFLLAGPIAGFYHQPRLVEMVQVISVVYLFGGLSTQFRIHINRQLRFVALALSDLVPLVLAFAGAALLALAGAGVWALVAQQVIMSLFGLLAVVIQARWWPGLPSRRAGMRPLLTFGLSFAAVQLITYTTRNIDSIAIGRVWGSANLGFYDRAYQLMVLPLNQINAPLSRVAVPVLARITDDRERYVNYLRQAQLIACYLTASVFLVVAAVGPQIVQLVLGDSWSFSGQILSVLAIGGVFRSIAQISYWMFMSQGLAVQQLKFTLVSQPLVIVIMLCGLPWGPLGVAAGFSCGFALNWAAALLWAGHVSQLNVKSLMADAARAILLFGAPGALAAFITVSTVPFDNPLKIVLALLAALSWFSVAWWLLPTVRRDIKVLLVFLTLAFGSKK